MSKTDINERIIVANAVGSMDIHLMTGTNTARTAVHLWTENKNKILIRAKVKHIAKYIILMD